MNGPKVLRVFRVVAFGLAAVAVFGFLLMSLSLILAGVVLLGMGLPPAGDALRAEVPRENVAE